MKRIELKAKPGDKVYIVRRDQVGVFRVYGPVCVDIVTIGDMGAAYRFIGDVVPSCYEEDVFTANDEAKAVAHELNYGLRTEEILIARCNYYHTKLAAAGLTDEMIFRDMPEIARKEVRSRTLKLENNPFKDVSEDETKG